jgi:hypothetical protein
MRLSRKQVLALLLFVTVIVGYLIIRLALS